MKFRNDKKLLSYLDLFFGILLIVYMITANKLSRARVAFTIPIIVLGVILIVYHFIKDEINYRIKYDSKYRKLHKIFKVIISIGLVFFIALESMIIIFPKYNDKESDYIVVLGAGLWQGYYPTETLRTRLNAAASLYEKNGETQKIVVSGGQGDDEEISEAEAMQKYLIDKGIDESNIILEDKSRNTTQNLKYSKEKIEEHSQKSIEELDITIVTTEFHAFRSNFLAKRCGYKNVENYSGKTVIYLIPVMYARESIAIVKSFILDR